MTRIGTVHSTLTINGRTTRLWMQQWQLLWALMVTPRLDRFAASDIVWPGNTVRPDFWQKQLSVLIYRLRNSLAGTQWRILGHGHQGWELRRG